ncbi:MAG: nucleotide exchange factor GrpE [Desulfobacteraceae bacterium]
MARKQEKTVNTANTGKEVEKEGDTSEEAVKRDKDVPEKGNGEDDPVKVLEDKLKEAENAAKESYDKMLRAAAEQENFKKRIHRETLDFQKFANESLIKELLPIVDNLERAVESSGPDQKQAQAIVEGVKMTLKEIYKVLERFNLKSLESEGKLFDPNFHQAVMQQETAEHPENIVLKEMQKGYILHDRLIRPAMVVVSKAMTKNNDGPSDGNETTDSAGE